MAYDDDATGEILQILFQDLEGLYVQVIGRLIKNKEIGILHQHSTEIQFASLSSTEFIHIVVLLFGREEEALQKLGSREVAPATKVDILGTLGDNVDDPLLLVKLQAVL